MSEAQAAALTPAGKSILCERRERERKREIERERETVLWHEWLAVDLAPQPPWSAAPRKRRRKMRSAFGICSTTR
jgi:hypothetical protein